MSHLGPIRIASIAALLGALVAPVRADAPAERPIEQLRHDEASLALDAGNFQRARKLYQLILLTAP